MFDPRLALASLSGESDAGWATAASPWVGMAFLGGIAVDEPTRAAAREMVTDRDRTEFLPDDPFEFMGVELEMLESLPIRAGFNVRAVDLDALRQAAEVCRDHDAVLEVNAHCRQDEMCATGAGETLLQEPERLVQQVETAATTGAVVSVKARAEVPGVDLPGLSERLAAAGADMLHVDAMDSEWIIEDIVERTDAFVIANNGVRDRATVEEYLEYGADAVSLARPSDDPQVLDRVNAAVVDWFATRV